MYNSIVAVLWFGRGDGVGRLFLFIVALSVLVAAPDVVLADASAEAGRVTYIKGDAFVIRNAEQLSLTEGSRVFSSDTLVTGESGRISLVMRDDSKIFVGRSSRIDVSEYVVKEKSLISGAFDMLWGKVRFYVASVNKGSAFSVSTKTAVLGVRGTEFLVTVPIPGGITDPTAIRLPPDLPAEVTRVVGIEGMVVGLSRSGERAAISPGVTVEFTQAGEVIFRFSDKPDVPRPLPGGGPDIPKVPGPADLRTPPPPQPHIISPGQFLDALPPV
ncbi:MAG: FecR family protein [Mariprofundaceae bacterium]|nr:FecR family protein [Mariprofundaceae bacterium]